MHRCLTVPVLCVYTAVLLAQSTTTRKVVHAGPDPTPPFSKAVAAGDFIYLTGTTGNDPRAANDAAAQTIRTLDSLGTVLKAAGVDFDNVVATTVYVKTPTILQAVDEAFAERWPSTPPARSFVVIENFAGQGPTAIEINMIAVRRGVSRSAVTPAGWARQKGFSYGIKAGDTVFTSGLTARNYKDNSLMNGDVKAQTTAVMDNLKAVLTAGGVDFSRVVLGRAWVAGREHFADMNAVWQTYYTDKTHLPSRATLRARFDDPQEVTEIAVTAVQNGQKEAVVAQPQADGSRGRPNPNYSAGMKVGNRMWITGTTGTLPNDNGDIKSQTREAIMRMQGILRAGGYDLADVVEANVYLADNKDYQAMNEAYKEFFPKDFPARTTVQAPNLGNSAAEIVMTAGR